MMVSLMGCRPDLDWGLGTDARHIVITGSSRRVSRDCLWEKDICGISGMQYDLISNQFIMEVRVSSAFCFFVSIPSSKETSSSENIHGF